MCAFAITSCGYTYSFTQICNLHLRNVLHFKIKMKTSRWNYDYIQIKRLILIFFLWNCILWHNKCLPQPCSPLFSLWAVLLFFWTISVGKLRNFKVTMSPRILQSNSKLAFCFGFSLVQYYIPTYNMVTNINLIVVHKGLWELRHTASILCIFFVLFCFFFSSVLTIIFLSII